MTKKQYSKTKGQGTAESMAVSKGKITSLSTFHKEPAYEELKDMLEYEKPEISVEFNDEKKEICFVFEKQSVSYIK